MPVIDELYIRNGTNRVPVDSIDNKAIEEIVINDQIYHFAKESAASGVDSVVCENAVNEPFRTIEAIGDTTQQTYSGHNLAYASSKNSLYTQYVKAEYIDLNNLILKPTNKTVTSSKMVRYNIAAKPNTTYKVSLDVKRIGTFAGQSSVQCYSGDTYISGTTLNITTETARYAMNVNTGTATKLGVQFNVMGGVAVGEENDIEFVVENFMITEGSATKAYEPYVGGTAAPNPNYPQDIINAGDNGLEVEVKSPNIFDASKAELTGCEWQDNTIMSTSSAYVDILVPAGNYTLTFERNKDFAIYLVNGKVGNGYFALIAATATTSTFNFTASYDGYLRIKWFNAGNAISNIQIVEGAEQKSYSPYFEPTTLSIPATVGDLELSFAKYNDTNKDSLIVDGIAKKVIYKQMIDSFIVDGSNVNGSVYKYKQTQGTKKYCHGISFSGLLKQKCNRARGYFSHVVKSRVGMQSGTTNEIWYGVNHDVVFWTGILDLLGFTVEKAADETQYTTAELTAAKDKFVEWVNQQAADGTPVCGSYVLPTPIEHDITNTELGDQLLALAANKGTNILEITGATSLDVSYWRQVLPDEEI